MDFVVTIRYSTDDVEADTNYCAVNDSIQALLSNTLPYMVDNLDIYFDVEEN